MSVFSTTAAHKIDILSSICFHRSLSDICIPSCQRWRAKIASLFHSGSKNLYSQLVFVCIRLVIVCFSLIFVSRCRQKRVTLLTEQVGSRGFCHPDEIRRLSLVERCCNMWRGPKHFFPEHGPCVPRDIFHTWTKAFHALA